MKKLFVLIVVCGLFSSCAPSIIEPAALEKLYIEDVERTRMTTLRPYYTYMGQRDGYHYVEFTRGGLGVKKTYKLPVSQVTSEVELDFTKNKWEWIPCVLDMSSESYKIKKKKLSPVVNIITC